MSALLIVVAQAAPLDVLLSEADKISTDAYGVTLPPLDESPSVLLDWTDGLLAAWHAADRKGEDPMIVVPTTREEVCLRVLRRISSGSLDPDDVLFVEVTKNGKVVMHSVDSRGEFEEPWKEGFFDWRAKELF